MKSSSLIIGSVSTFTQIYLIFVENASVLSKVTIPITPVVVRLNLFDGFRAFALFAFDVILIGKSDRNAFCFVLTLVLQF